MGRGLEQLVTAEDLKMLKRASIPQVIGWATRIYRQGFEDGLREAEKEFDDPDKYQIIYEDDAKERIGEEQYRKLIE